METTPPDCPVDDNFAKRVMASAVLGVNLPSPAKFRELPRKVQRGIQTEIEQQTAAINSLTQGMMAQAAAGAMADKLGEYEAKRKALTDAEMLMLGNLREYVAKGGGTEVADRAMSRVLRNMKALNEVRDSYASVPMPSKGTVIAKNAVMGDVNMVPPNRNDPAADYANFETQEESA